MAGSDRKFHSGGKGLFTKKVRWEAPARTEVIHRLIDVLLYDMVKPKKLMPNPDPF
jgi:hypothetical protein